MAVGLILSAVQRLLLCHQCKYVCAVLRYLFLYQQRRRLQSCYSTMCAL
jgi:hypothetical protein